MNRNDLAVAPSFTSYGVSPGGERPPRSPRKSSKSPSPSRGKKSSVTSLFGGTGTASSFPKAAPLLEDASVHMALPSFHARAGSRMGGWQCAGCSHQNHSALSNECSVCGMMRTISMHSNTISESSGGDSYESFQYDGNSSENSLSLHNSFSAVDPNLGDEIAHANYSYGHASLPVGLNSSLSSLPTTLPSMHHSFSINEQPNARGRSRNARRSSTNRRTRGGLFMDDDSESGHSSVRSFCTWNGNERIKSWQCPTCTFVNESVLQLACEMCGNLRNGESTAPEQLSPSVTTVPTAATVNHATENHPSNVNDHKNEEEEEDDEVLEELKKEQLRDFVNLQQEILSSLDNRGTRESTAAFQTEDLDREIGQIQAELVESSHHTTAQQSLGLENLEDQQEFGEDEMEQGDEERLEALVATQKQIMKEFQQGREATTTVSPTATWQPLTSKFSPPALRAQPHDPLFGHNNANTAPRAEMTLRESMQAAGGSLRIEDICVPILWGENFSSSSKQASGEKIIK